MSRNLALPRHGTVVAYMALFVALGGTSYAAVTLSKNSVRSTTIKNGQVKAVDLATNAVSSQKVKDGSLLSKDFKAGQLVAGAPGPKGATGPPGPPGPPGPTGATGATGATNVSVRSVTISGTGGASGTAPCNAGERATGGGFYAGGNGGSVRLLNSLPSPGTGVPTGWSVTVIQDNITFPFSGTVYVVCAAP